MKNRRSGIDGGGENQYYVNVSVESGVQPRRNIMAMKRCPVCGEKYSDTYRHCPFCEEEAALRDGPSRRKGGHRGSQKGPSLLSPMLIIVIVVLAGLLVWLLFGNPGGGSSGPSGSSPVPSSSQSSVSAVKPSVSGSGSASSQQGASSSGAPSGGQGSVKPEDLSSLPDTLTLNKTDFTLPVGDSPVKLTASGGSGSYTWSSSDEGIASVDENGRVVAISAGTATITVTDGNGKGQCIVRVKAGTGVPNTGGSVPASGDNGSGGVHALNREDVTLRKSDPPFQLKVSGVTTAITWSSSNSSVATVDADGTVRAAGSGKASITASWDGHSLSCIVRVP